MFWAHLVWTFSYSCWGTEIRDGWPQKKIPPTVCISTIIVVHWVVDVFFHRLNPNEILPISTWISDSSSDLALYFCYPTIRWRWGHGWRSLGTIAILVSWCNLLGGQWEICTASVKQASLSQFPTNSCDHWNMSPMINHGAVEHCHNISWKLITQTGKLHTLSCT